MIINIFRWRTKKSTTLQPWVHSSFKSGLPHLLWNVDRKRFGWIRMKLMKSPTPILVKTFESSSRMVLLSRNLLLSIQGVYLLIARRVDIKPWIVWWIFNLINKFCRSRVREATEARRKGRHTGMGKRKGTADARMPQKELWMKRFYRSGPGCLNW